MTPVQKRILLALDKHGDMEADEIAEIACCSYETLTAGCYMRNLVNAGLVRVAKYRRALQSGPAVPVYSVTPGVNAKRPKPYTDAEKCRRWRKKSGYRSAERTTQTMNELIRITS